MKNLDTVVGKINAEYGKGAIMCLGNNEGVRVESLSTGSIKVDEILGVGGLPRGRITEVYGPESSGKTTLALHVIAEAHRLGGNAAFIDAEHALDPTYAENLGVDLKKLWLSQPSSGEEALEIMEMLIRSDTFDVIVLDSVAALVPRAELEGSMGDAQMGLQARLMSQAMRKLTAVLGRTRCVVIFINQIREKIGVTYGPSTTTSGGRALKFFSSVRVEVRRKETIQDKGIPVGSRTKIKIVKNKVAPPFRETLVDIYYGRGICAMTELIQTAENCEVISKRGTWMRFGDLQLGQGMQQTRIFLDKNPEIFATIAQSVKEKQIA